MKPSSSHVHKKTIKTEIYSALHRGGLNGDYIVFPVDDDEKYTKGTMARRERCFKKQSNTKKT